MYGCVSLDGMNSGGHPKASNQWDEAVPTADMSPVALKALRQSFLLLPFHHLVGRNPMMPPADTSHRH